MIVNGAQARIYACDDNEGTVLAAARTLLFAARDTRFVVALPVFLYTVLHSNLGSSAEQAFFSVGAFLAAWTIAYGVVQGLAPVLLANARQSQAKSCTSVEHCTGAVTIAMLSLSVAVWLILAQGEAKAGGGPVATIWVV